MLRLTLMLGAAIYAGLVIYSEPRPAAGAPGAEVTRAAPSVDPLLSSAPAGGTDEDAHLALHDGRVLEIAAVIEPVRMHENGDGIVTVSTLADEMVITSASAGQPDRPIVEVTGSRVNLRAGPSTGNRVLGALSEGQQAELISALDNGWSHIRAIDSGVEGYMAARFLSPAD